MTGAAMALLFALRQPRWRPVSVCIALVGGVGVTLTYSRGASLVLALAVVWGLWKFRADRRLPVIGAALLAAGLAYLPFVPERFWERMESLAEPSQDPTLSRRLSYNLIGVDLFFERPVLGVGPGNYRERYLDFEYRGLEGRDQRRRPLHNMYLLIACEQGLFGLVSFGALLLVALRRLALARREQAPPAVRELAEVLQLGLVCYLLACVLMRRTSTSTPGA